MVGGWGGRGVGWGGGYRMWKASLENKHEGRAQASVKDEREGRAWRASVEGEHGGRAWRASVGGASVGGGGWGVGERGWRPWWATMIYNQFGEAHPPPLA